MNERPQVSMEMMSNPLYLCGAREMVSSVASRLGFSDESCGQIALALDEALCNVIRHGYGRAADRPIWVSLFPVGVLPEGGSGGDVRALRIVVEDEAKQVEPTQIRGRKLEDIRPGGLGVHIIHEVMDEVVFEKRSGPGMRLTMVKKLTDATARKCAAGEGGESGGGGDGCTCDGGEKGGGHG